MVSLRHFHPPDFLALHSLERSRIRYPEHLLDRQKLVGLFRPRKGWTCVGWGESAPRWWKLMRFRGLVAGWIGKWVSLSVKKCGMVFPSYFLSARALISIYSSSLSLIIHFLYPHNSFISTRSWRSTIRSGLLYTSIFTKGECEQFISELLVGIVAKCIFSYILYIWPRRIKFIFTSEKVT